MENMLACDCALCKHFNIGSLKSRGSPKGIKANPLSLLLQWINCVLSGCSAPQRLQQKGLALLQQYTELGVVIGDLQGLGGHASKVECSLMCLS